MPYWRRTLYTLWITQFLAIAGFSFVFPFLPYYIQSLGVTDVRAVAWWSGLGSSLTFIALAIMAPVWGVLADRYGRKVMLLRATLIGAVVLGLMGFVVTVQQLMGLRFLQGVFTGTIAASTALAAGVVPYDRRGAALGSLQTAIYLGTTLGPLLGGIVGDAFGFRQSFWITAACLLVSGVLVALFVHERFQPAAAKPSPAAAAEQAPNRGPATPKRRPRFGYRESLGFLFASGGILLSLLLARILLRAGMMVATPVMALLVQSLQPSGQHAALVTGLISGAMAIGGALGAPVIGRWGDRWGHRRLLVASGLLGVCAFLPQAFAPSAAWLMVCQFMVGIAEGGMLASTMALLAGVARGGNEGKVFGLDASATGLAGAIGPLMGASVATFGLRAPFILAALLLGIGALVVFLRRGLPDTDGRQGDVELVEV